MRPPVPASVRQLLLRVHPDVVAASRPAKEREHNDVALRAVMGALRGVAEPEGGAGAGVGTGAGAREVSFFLKDGRVVRARLGLGADAVDAAAKRMLAMADGVAVPPERVAVPVTKPGVRRRQAATWTSSTTPRTARPMPPDAETMRRMMGDDRLRFSARVPFVDAFVAQKRLVVSVEDSEEERRSARQTALEALRAHVPLQVQKELLKPGPGLSVTLEVASAHDVLFPERRESRAVVPSDFSARDMAAFLEEVLWAVAPHR